LPEPYSFLLLAPRTFAPIAAAKMQFKNYCKAALCHYKKNHDKLLIKHNKAV